MANKHDTHKLSLDGIEVFSPETEEQAHIASVPDLMRAYMNHVRQRYRRPDGKLTSHYHHANAGTLYFLEAVGDLSIDKVTSRAMRHFQRQLASNAGLARRTVNGYHAIVKAAFKWGAREGLVSPSIFGQVQIVDGLRRGESEAREPDPREPVPLEVFKATLPFMQPIPADIARIQLYTGMRGGEVIRMRECEIDRSGDTWLYTPSDHKTAHHGHKRVVPLNKQAQAILAPYIADREPSDYLFSPSEAVEAYLRKKWKNRRCSRKWGNKPGTNRVEAPKVKPGTHYRADSYRHHISRACQRAFPLPKPLRKIYVEGDKGSRLETDSEWRERLGEKYAEAKAWRKSHTWTPHQVRHLAGTLVREKYGEEVARAFLGHRDPRMTAHYTKGVLVKQATQGAEGLEVEL